MKDSDLIKRGDVFALTTKRNNVWDIVTDASGRGLTEIVNSIPAVDAVEVVRCRECKGWQKLEYSELHFCPVVHEFTEDDFFCKRGKRREEEP